MRVAIEVVIEFVIVFCDRICDSVCDSTVGSDPLRIVATSLQIHLSSLCADAHRQTLVYIYIYIYVCILERSRAHPRTEKKDGTKVMLQWA